MLSVGRVAKLTRVSTRTLRYYESIGLLQPATRNESNYRYYSADTPLRVEKIRDLQSLGFALEEIREIIDVAHQDIIKFLEVRLEKVKCEIAFLEERRRRIESLLSITNKVVSGDPVTPKERTLYMEGIREQIVKTLATKYPRLTEVELAYLTREQWLEVHPHMQEFVEAAKECRDFASQHNLLLGPGRGSSPSSMTIFGLGFSTIDPMKHQMLPERLTTQAPNIHIDVEFERGQIFVDFCQKINERLALGQIQAFRMPLLDIIKNTHQRLGCPIDYDLIDENSDVVLRDLRNGDIAKIFNFDFSKNALVMKYESFLPEFVGLDKQAEYMRAQTIHDFRDIINITALWRPYCEEILERIYQYRDIKRTKFEYDFLPDVLKTSLEPNFGMIIFHEDILRIIAHYTDWPLSRCNLLRQQCFRKMAHTAPDWSEFLELAPPQVAALILEESKWSFCLPHAIAFAQFTKQTAVLKRLHQKIYYQEIETFESKHGFTWDDIGIRLKGVSLLQHS